jgi:hypothetical protein
MTFRDEFNATMTVRYAVGSQEREVQVLSGGVLLEDHVERIQTESKSNPDWVTFILPAGGGIGLRRDAIVAIEFPR